MSFKVFLLKSFWNLRQRQVKLDFSTPLLRTFESAARKSILVQKKGMQSSKEITALVLTCSFQVMNENRQHLLVGLWSLWCFPQTIKISLAQLMIHQGHTTLKSYLQWLKEGGGDHVLSEPCVVLMSSLVLHLPCSWNDVKHPGQIFITTIMWGLRLW